MTPLMSRDFRIEADSLDASAAIESKLLACVDPLNGNPVFAVDNRGKSLFVELIFARELHERLRFLRHDGLEISDLSSKLAFVAIKNGKHESTGHVFSNRSLQLPKQIPLKHLNEVIKRTALEEVRAGTSVSH